jgi:hypothetical protein
VAVHCAPKISAVKDLPPLRLQVFPVMVWISEGWDGYGL